MSRHVLLLSHFFQFIKSSLTLQQSLLSGSKSPHNCSFGENDPARTTPVARESRAGKATSFGVLCRSRGKMSLGSWLDFPSRTTTTIERTNYLIFCELDIVTIPSRSLASLEMN